VSSVSLRAKKKTGWRDERREGHAPAANDGHDARAGADDLGVCEDEWEGKAGDDDAGGEEAAEVCGAGGGLVCGKIVAATVGEDGVGERGEDKGEGWGD
jgi:hypothetical protein